MDKLQEFAIANRLLTRYGELLTVSQLEIMNYYYQFDLSLSEIAENLNISRTAVQDCVKKSLKKLQGFEAKLKLLKNAEALKKVLLKIKQNPGDKLAIEELERMIEDGI